MEKGHEIWYMGCLYRSGSLRTVTRELAGYKLGLVGIKEVRWDKGGTIQAGNYILFHGKGNENRIFCITQNSITS
jgi:hypothetical protein